MAEGYRHRSTNVNKIENDYVRNADLHREKLARQRIGLRRRLAVFFIIASVVVISLVSTIFNQNERLAQKEAEKEKVLEQLEEIKKEQSLLKMEIKKLEDDEYVAKLARKEYFLSEDGEIIFTIPKEDKIDKKEND